MDRPEYQFSIFLFIELLIERKHLSDDAGAFAFAFTKQNPMIWSHILRMTHESKQYRCLFIRADFLATHDAFDDRRLSNIANVNGGLETFVNGGRMKENGNLRLEE